VHTPGAKNTESRTTPTPVLSSVAQLLLHPILPHAHRCHRHWPLLEAPRHRHWLLLDARGPQLCAALRNPASGHRPGLLLDARRPQLYSAVRSQARQVRQGQETRSPPLRSAARSHGREPRLNPGPRGHRRNLSPLNSAQWRHGTYPAQQRQSSTQRTRQEATQAAARAMGTLQRLNDLAGARAKKPSGPRYPLVGRFMQDAVREKPELGKSALLLGRRPARGGWQPAFG